ISADDAEVQERLRVLRIDLQRTGKLIQRLVRLIRVEVADAEVRADVGIVRRNLQRFRVPGNRVVVALGVKVEVPELDPGGGILRLTIGDRLEGADLVFVEHGRRGTRAGGCRGRGRGRDRGGRARSD